MAPSLRRPPLFRCLSLGVASCWLQAGVWTSAYAEADDLPLPQWSENHLKAFGPSPVLGGGLFPGTDYLPEIAPTFDESAPDETSQLPLVLRLEGVKDLPADLIDAYFPDGLTQRVLDPQRLLTQSRRDGILNFLEYHHREAESEIYILVLGPQQRVPGEIDLGRIHEAWFGDRLSALVLYNFGNPEMSRLILGPLAEKRVPEHRRVHTCLKAINEAVVSSNAEEQLERFLMELSRQLYWIETAFRAGARLEEERLEYAMEVPVTATKDRDRMDSPVQRRLLLSFAVGVGLVAGSGVAVMLLQRRAGARSYYFPTPRTQPRLGAPHGGGNRLVLSFDEPARASRPDA